MRQCSVPVWGSDNPEEKPFLALYSDHVYVGDPVNRRVLAFDEDGPFAWALQDIETLAFPEGLAVVDDVLYVADAHTPQIVGYSLQGF